MRNFHFIYARLLVAVTVVPVLAMQGVSPFSTPSKAAKYMFIEFLNFLLTLQHDTLYNTAL